MGQGKLFTARSGDWTWHFTDEEAWRSLAPAPELPSPNSSIVKKSPVRMVFRRDGFYVKVERPEPKLGLSLLKALFAPKAKAEFDAARALASKGVPVVEAIGYGSAGADQALVTRAVFGAETASEHYNARFAEDGNAPAEYLEKWASFVRKVVDSGLLHPDFHNGNILYKPESGEFLLVDVFGVKSGSGASQAQKEAMRRILFEMRRNLPKEAFLRLAKDCGAPGDPADYIAKGLAEEARKVRAEWPKRKRQLLDAYPKFVEEYEFPDGSPVLILLDSAKRPLASPEQIAAKDSFDIVRDRDSLFKAFYLELAGIPHRRAVAWEPDNGNVHFERVRLGPQASKEEIEDFDFQARHFGVDSSTASFARNAKGRLIVASCGLKLP